MVGGNYIEAGSMKMFDDCGKGTAGDMGGLLVQLIMSFADSSYCAVDIYRLIYIKWVVW